MFVTAACPFVANHLRLPRLGWEVGFEVAKDVGVDVGGGAGAFRDAVSAAWVHAHVEDFAQ